MLSCHTWPQWRGPSVDGVTYLVREVPIGPIEYAFGRTKIFIRSAKTVRGGPVPGTPGVSLFEADRAWFYMQKEIIFPCDLGSFHKYKDGFDMHGILQSFYVRRRHVTFATGCLHSTYWSATEYCRTVNVIASSRSRFWKSFVELASTTWPRSSKRRTAASPRARR